MATAAADLCVAQIGETAGMIWKMLYNQGPMTVAQVVKTVGQPRDSVMQGLGWLAREGKVSIDENGRKRMVSLR